MYSSLLRAFAHGADLSGMVHIKYPLLLIRKSSLLAAAGFLSHYQNGPLPYV